MIRIQVGATSSTNISWRDEINDSPAVESEGLRKLREAIKTAKLSIPDSDCESEGKTARAEIGSRRKAAVSGA